MRQGKEKGAGGEGQWGRCTNWLVGIQAANKSHAPSLFRKIDDAAAPPLVGVNNGDSTTIILAFDSYRLVIA